MGETDRLIFHLSFDFGKNNENKSLNFHTPDELCTVKYNDLDKAVEFSLKLCEEEVANIFYSKSDIKSTFRLVPCRPEDFCLMLMQATHPISGRKYFFVEKNLPFGSSISCALFTIFSESLCQITRFFIGRPYSTLSYLDDFLFISHDEKLCNEMVRTFLRICHTIGCPISMEKTEWATQTFVFLGILLNGKTMSLAVPFEKKQKALRMLNWVLGRKKVMIHTIQKLTGMLNFLNRAIVPGQAFTRKMYLKLRLCDKQGNKLKKYHHVSLDSNFLDDCRVWKVFLQNSQSGELCRPFLDWAGIKSAKILQFYSDATANPELGVGATF